LYPEITTNVTISQMYTSPVGETAYDVAYGGIKELWGDDVKHEALGKARGSRGCVEDYCGEV